MKQFIFFLFLVVCSSVYSQNNVVTLECYAPDFVGQQVQLNEIEDYLSLKESTIASGTVQADSTFTLVFKIDKIQKVVLRVGTNRSQFYIQPGAEYLCYYPLKNEYDPYRPAGNQVEITFVNLDTADINYKVLAFNHWMDNYMALNYSDHKKNPIEFNKSMDKFKEAAERYYIKDTNTFIYDYVRFSIASIDNIQQIANRNRHEKHDFYIKRQAVLYQNDVYMDYFKNFYKGIMQIVPMEVNNRVYLGLLKSSPTLIMNALGKEYTLKNMRVRELTMIQMLGELYYQSDYPQTNIIDVLDSIQKFAMFDAHKIIAKNTKSRLTEVASGGRAPDFVVKTSKGLRNLTDFKGKYLYMHFFDPSSEKSKIELPILRQLYSKYNNEVTFLTICKESMVNDENRKVLNDFGWEVAIVPDSYATIWETYKIATMPIYVLIDPYSYVVQSPALGPQPNNLYQTIDKVFFDIQKAMAEDRK